MADFSSFDLELWPMTLNNELDLKNVNMNQHAKHLGQRLKGKGSSYTLPSVGPGADPGVQAASQQVTISHPPGGMLPLHSARPAVTFPAAEHHRPLNGTHFTSQRRIESWVDLGGWKVNLFKRYNPNARTCDSIVNCFCTHTVLPCNSNKFTNDSLEVAVWRSGNALVSLNEVNLRWARLALGWVTVSGFDSRRRHFISVCHQPSRSTQHCTLRGTVTWVPTKKRWCSAAGKVTAGLAECNGSLPPGGWLKSPAGWLHVHRYQLRAQRSVTSMGSLYLLPSLIQYDTICKT